MTPSVELQEFIEEIKDADLVQGMKDGYGELFRVCPHNDYSENKNFAWTEKKIINAPVGSYYSLNGGNIHAGSGSTFSEVRIMLFWTFCPKNLDPYDIDKQETKLTLIVTIGSKIWGSLVKKKIERRDDMSYILLFFDMFRRIQKYMLTNIQKL